MLYRVVSLHIHHLVRIAAARLSRSSILVLPSTNTPEADRLELSPPTRPDPQGNHKRCAGTLQTPPEKIRWNRACI